MLLTSISGAEILRWPQACNAGELQITNLKDVGLRVWLQKFQPTLISETEINIKPSGIHKLYLKTSSSRERFNIMNLNGSDAIAVQFMCSTKVYRAHSFEGGNLTYRKSDLPQSQIWLQNLYTGNNLITVEYQNRRFEKIASSSITLAALGQYSYKVPLQFENWAYVKISAKQRFAAHNLTSVGSDGPFMVNPQASNVDVKASYFVVAPRSQVGDSYTVKTTSPEMIQLARDQIANPSLEKILFAKIQKNGGGFNRNWSKLEKSFWSWSVSEITNFADVGSTACNGVPQAVEDRVDTWVKNPGQICFWNYRILKEISADEVASGIPIQ